MTYEDPLTTGQRIRVAAISLAIKTETSVPLPTTGPDGQSNETDRVIAIAKRYEDYIARETRLAESAAQAQRQ